MSRTRLVAMVAAALMPSFTVWAQWSSDPSVPLAVADRSGTQSLAKMVATPDGGLYVSWFEDYHGGNDVYLQRLDMLGNEQWAHNGVLVADRGLGETQNYGLSIDTAGNALLAFRDDRGATVEITVAKVAPDGSLVWGVDGVQVSRESPFVASPRVTGTDDGGSVVAWSGDPFVKAQKLGPAGEKLWGPEGVTLAPDEGWFKLADLRSSGGGTAIISFTQFTGIFVSPVHLWAQKLASPDGAFTWGSSHVQVYDDPNGSLQITSEPEIVSDGAGGAVFAWYTVDPSLQCRVQRVLADGSMALTAQGVEVSIEASRVRVDPSMIFDETTQEILVAWREQSHGQGTTGVYAQKVDSAGVRQWGDSGVLLRDLSVAGATGVTILPHADQAYVGWIQSNSYGDDPVVAARLTSDGTIGWSPSPVEVGNPVTHSSNIAAVAAGPDYVAYAWTDGDNAVADILVASLLPDGSLGYSAEIFAEGLESGGTTEWSATGP